MDRDRCHSFGVKLGNWNLERASTVIRRYALRAHTDVIGADLWVFTDTRLRHCERRCKTPPRLADILRNSSNARRAIEGLWFRLERSQLI